MLRCRRRRGRPARARHVPELLIERRPELAKPNAERGRWRLAAPDTALDHSLVTQPEPDRNLDPLALLLHQHVRQHVLGRRIQSREPARQADLVGDHRAHLGGIGGLHFGPFGGRQRGRRGGGDEKEAGLDVLLLDQHAELLCRSPSGEQRLRPGQRDDPAPHRPEGSVVRRLPFGIEPHNRGIVLGVGNAAREDETQGGNCQGRSILPRNTCGSWK